MFKNYFLYLARYQQWAYQQLELAMKPVSDDDYYDDKGLYFKSLHGTLNHLLLADRLWYSRCLDRTMVVTDLAQELVKEREQLSLALAVQSQLWCEYLEQLDETKMTSHLNYTNTKGQAKVAPLSQTIAHVFNHGAHHRGQMTTVLTQLGLMAPSIDLLYFKDELMLEEAA